MLDHLHQRYDEAVKDYNENRIGPTELVEKIKTIKEEQALYSKDLKYHINRHLRTTGS